VQNFAIGVVVSMAVGVGVTLLRTKPGERLRGSLQVAGAILAISLACGLLALLGVKVTGIN